MGEQDEQRIQDEKEPADVEGHVRQARGESDEDETPDVEGHIKKGHIKKGHKRV